MAPDSYSNSGVKYDAIYQLLHENDLISLNQV